MGGATILLLLLLFLIPMANDASPKPPSSQVALDVARIEKLVDRIDERLRRIEKSHASLRRRVTNRDRQVA
jgi:hypothetical protein